MISLVTGGLSVPGLAFATKPSEQSPVSTSDTLTDRTQSQQTNWIVIMFSPLVRIILAISGAITGLFVARDAPNFSVVEMSIALVLIAVLVAAAAFGPAMLRRFRKQIGAGKSNDTRH